MTTPRIAALLVLGGLGLAGQDARPAPKLPLSDAQKRAMEAIQTGALAKAAAVAERFKRATKQIYANMLADQPDEKLRVQLDAELKAAAGELLTIKGQSFRDSIKVLTAEQRRALRDEVEKAGEPRDLGEMMLQLF